MTMKDVAHDGDNTTQVHNGGGNFIRIMIYDPFTCDIIQW